MGGVFTDRGIQGRRIRVLLGVSVLEGHDRGLKYIAKKFREAGMEVVYITYEMIEEIAVAAIQESVDVIGVSSSTAGHMTLFSDLIESLKRKGADDILVIGGGIIPTVDIPALKKMGVKGAFGPGTSGDEVVDYIQKILKINESL